MNTAIILGYLFKNFVKRCIIIVTFVDLKCFGFDNPPSCPVLTVRQKANGRLQIVCYCYCLYYCVIDGRYHVRKLKQKLTISLLLLLYITL